LPKQYQIIPTKTFLKDLGKRVDPQYARQVEKVIDKLAKNPYQGIKLTSIKIGK
jgi:mRNA-degrading endonuclease RelE of RelBE toxin-antitoxin system